MSAYTLKPARQADISVLYERLRTLKIPFQEVSKDRDCIIRIGPDAEYEMQTSVGRGGRISKATISIRYEHPGVKGVVNDWMDHCGLEASEDFYKWHAGLSPSILEAIRATWRIDLTGQAVTPVRFGKYVLVFMFAQNQSRLVATHLSGLFHKRMEKGEFIRCEEFAVTGKDPADVEAYTWFRDADTRLFVTDSSAPATTLLCLWIVPRGARVEISIDRKIVV